MTKTRRGRGGEEGSEEEEDGMKVVALAAAAAAAPKFYQGMLSRFWPHANYWEVLFRKLSPCPLLHFTAN